MNRTLTETALVALLAARLWMPAEAAADGDTLWLVVFTLMVFGLQLLTGGQAAVRQLVRHPVAWGLTPLLIGTLVSSSWPGCQTRTAMNLAWEWIGTVATTFAMVLALRTSHDVARLARVLVVGVTCLAGLGLYQAYVWLPGEAAQYGQSLRELQRLEHPDLAAGPTQRYQELQRRLAQDGVPTEGHARTMFLLRLDSREPFALFALTNTLAGFLLAAIVLAIGLAWNQFQTRLWRIGGWSVLPAGTLFVLLWCLLLTKSRTAWLGLAFGGTLVAAQLWVRHSTRAAKLLPYAAMGLFLLAGMVVGITFLGGLDTEVLTEAPKSLRYRLEYWQGSLAFLKNTPVWGVGLGQFRQAYLQTKLAESSEEIADPHNFVLEAWSQGGLLAMGGAVFLALFATVRAFKPLVVASEPATNASLADDRGGTVGHWSSWDIGLLLSFIVAFVGPLFLRGVYDERPLLLLPGAAALLWLLPVWERTKNAGATDDVVLRGVFAVAAAAWFLHLLASGGFGMPAVMSWLCVLLVASLGTGSTQGVQAATKEIQTSRPIATRIGYACGAMAFGMAAWCWWGVEGPVRRSGERSLLAEAAITRRGDRSQAAQYLAEAIAIDPLNHDYAVRLAQLELLDWQSSQRPDLSNFHRAIERFSDIQKTPDRTFQNSRAVAEAWLLRFARTGDRSALANAEAAAREALRLHPTLADLAALLAKTLVLAGNSEAVKYARQAIEQDDLNHQLGHSDRYLPADIRKSLEAIVPSTTKTDPR